MQNNFRGHALLFTLFSLLMAPAAHAVSDNFSTNPLTSGAWSFGVGDNSHNQFTWTPGALSVHLDSSLPTARLDLPLGTTLSDSSSFLLTARLSFHITSAPGDQAAQIAFGLTNHTLTGGDRTGTPANFSSDNTFNTVEFNYFPNVSPSFGGPTLTPAVFGGSSGGDAFSNFAAIFGDASNLGSHSPPGITQLPQDTVLEAHLAYNGASKIATLTMYQVDSHGALTQLNTGPLELDLGAFGGGYDATNPFLVDSLSIMTYQDGFTTPAETSLVGDITYQSIGLTLVPEPSTAVLALLAGIAFIPLRRRLRRSCFPAAA
jgi:hypothetical protein